MAIMMATHGHHDGNPLPSLRQPVGRYAATGTPAGRHTGSQAHRHMGGVGCGEVSVGGFLFGIAWGSRNPCGEKFFLQLLSAHVSTGNWRREKLFKKFLSAQVVPGAPSRSRYQAKPAQKWLHGRPRAPVRTRYQPKLARIGPLGHHGAERSRRKSCSPHTFPPETGAERSRRKNLSTQVSASPGCAKKELSHTHLTSPHPASPHPAHHTLHATHHVGAQARQHEGAQARWHPGHARPS